MGQRVRGGGVQGGLQHLVQLHGEAEPRRRALSRRDGQVAELEHLSPYC